METYQIPRKYWGLLLEDFPPRNPSQAQAKADCVDFVDALPETQKPGVLTCGQGLALCGPNGTGKTLLACLTAMYAHRRHKVNVLFVPLADYFDAFHARWQWADLAKQGSTRFAAKVASFDEYRERIERQKLVVFDDVGAEHHTGSDTAIKEVNRFFRIRTGAGRPSIMTTNLLPQEWPKKYGDRVASFVNEAFVQVTVNGRDQRRGKG